MQPSWPCSGDPLGKGVDYPQCAVMVVICSNVSSATIPTSCHAARNVRSHNLADLLPSHHTPRVQHHCQSGGWHPRRSKTTLFKGTSGALQATQTVTKYLGVPSLCRKVPHCNTHTITSTTVQQACHKTMRIDLSNCAMPYSTIFKLFWIINLSCYYSRCQMQTRKQ